MAWSNEHIKWTITLGPFPWSQQVAESPITHNSQSRAVGRSPVDTGEAFCMCTVRGDTGGIPYSQHAVRNEDTVHLSPGGNHMANSGFWRRLLDLPNWGTPMSIFHQKSCFLTIWISSSNGCICFSTVPSLNNEETAQIILGHSMYHNAKSLGKCSLHKPSLINRFLYS